MMLVNVEKQTGNNLIFRGMTLEDAPVDLIMAYNYSLFILNVRQNLPEEYMPKKWQLYFPDEVDRCVKRYLDSLKSGQSSGVGTDKEPDFKENVLADQALEMIRKARES